MLISIYFCFLDQTENQAPLVYSKKRERRARRTRTKRIECGLKNGHGVLPCAPASTHETEENTHETIFSLN